MRSNYAVIVRSCVLFCGVAVGALSPPAWGQGWGFSPKTVTIVRLLPPTVNLRGKAVRVEASLASNFNGSGGLDDMLKTRLTTLVQKDPRFIVSESSPQTILRFKVTTFYTEQYAITKGSGLLGTGPQTTTHAFRGKIEVAYQAVSAATGQALDSEILKEVAGYDMETSGGFSWHTDKKKQAAETSENECRDQMVQGITDQMAERIAALGRPIVVHLPGGKLNEVSALAIAGRWGNVEEKASSMDKFPKPQDDAYRVYLVALAKEAQAYQLTSEANDSYDGKRTDITPAMAAKDMDKAQSLMDEAGALYKSALQAKSGDKDFLDGDTRAEQAISIYATIARYKKESEAAAATPPPPPAGVASPASVREVAVKSAVGKTPLDEVLNMCQHGVDVDTVRDYIQSSDFLALAKDSGYKFSFSNDPARLQDSCKANAAIYSKLIRTRLAESSKTVRH